MEKTGRQKKTFQKNCMGKGHYFFSYFLLFHMDIADTTLNRTRDRFSENMDIFVGLHILACCEYLLCEDL